MALEIAPLDKSFDRDPFDCGIPALNKFLKTHARQSQEKGFNRTFVIFDAADPEKKVLGYYSIAMSEINLEILPEAQRKGLPRHPVPVARLGRLAVDQSAIGQGLGGLLLADALKRVKAVAKSVGTHAIVVDAKDETAKNFYLKYGFIPFEIQAMSLFLPVTTWLGQAASLVRPPLLRPHSGPAA